MSSVALGLSLLLGLFGWSSCRRTGLARAAAEEGSRPRQGDLFHWDLEDRESSVLGQGADSSVLYVGRRPACAARFTKALPLAEIWRHCPVSDQPIVFRGPNWCRYRFSHGNFVLFEAPSFAYLRQSLVEGATISMPTGWGFFWTNDRGISSVVIRKPGGAALVLQAPRRVCSRDALRQLALGAASRIAEEGRAEAVQASR